ncbi:Transposase [Phytophthora megakarya]|uniref:Transposase n=1 Tax=Phytophthora megakarya TaxID=4795 RepID=A0A225VU67_9STRA|nr:Transposase [Phytophthora megakarya]
MKKSFLSCNHRLARLTYAKKYVQLTPEAWEGILFTTKPNWSFKVLWTGSVCRRKHEAFSEKATFSTFKNGRDAVLVLGYICGKGVGRIHIGSESTIGDYYCKVLRTKVPTPRSLKIYSPLPRSYWIIFLLTKPNLPGRAFKNSLRKILN